MKFYKTRKTDIIIIVQKAGPRVHSYYYGLHLSICGLNTIVPFLCSNL